MNSCMFHALFSPHHLSGTITKVKKSKNLGEKKRKKNDRLKEISWKKRSVSDPHTQTESLQVESQLCLWFMNFTHFARSHLRVIQVLQTNQAGHDKLLLIVSHQHLLCQQVLQTIGSDMKNSHNLTPSLPASPADSWVWHQKVTNWQLCQRVLHMVRSDMENSHKVTSSLPESSTDNWVWHGKQSQIDPFSASKSCMWSGLTWKMS